MSRSWCIAGLFNIVGSYGIFPSLSCDELSFPFEISLLSEWTFLWIWEHLIYVLHMNTRGDNGVLYWFTWYMFWHSTHGFPRWHWGNLCIGVDARSCLCFSGRNLGAFFEVLCVGLSIMNMNLLLCYFSTNSRIDWTERIALRWFRTIQTILSYVLH